MMWWRHARRMTPNCRRVLTKSRDIAGAAGHTLVSPDHVAVALLEDGNNVAAQILVGLGADAAELIRQIRARVEMAGTDRSSTRPLLRSSVGLLVEAARREAIHIGYAYIGTEHLLLALLGDDECALVQALRQQGHEPSRVRGEMMEVLDLRPAKVYDLEAEFPNVRRLCKEDLPPDVQSDPMVDFLLQMHAGLSDATYARDPFVQRALARRPKTAEELIRYIAEEYTEAIRSIQEGNNENEP